MIQATGCEKEAEEHVAEAHHLRGLLGRFVAGVVVSEAAFFRRVLDQVPVQHEQQEERGSRDQTPTARRWARSCAPMGERQQRPIWIMMPKMPANAPRSRS